MGLRYESMADMPEGMRQKCAKQMIRKENIDQRAVGENAEALPVADEARRFQGSGAIFGALSVENCNAATRASAGPYNGNGKGRKQKYHASPAAVPLKNGKVLKFDSRKEMRRYLELAELQKAGEIRNLRLQVDFTLQEGFTTTDGERVRAIRYKADFTYDERDHDREEVAADCGFEAECWNRVVEDVKGVRTKEYAMKKKMMMDVWGIEIREV